MSATSVSTWLRFASATALVAVIALSGTSVRSQSDVRPVNDLPNPYETVRNWGTMPEGRTWGSTAGIDLDPDGKSVWAIDRCGANTCAGSNTPIVVKFDASGKLLRTFGAGMFVFPHGMHVDRDGNHGGKHVARIDEVHQALRNAVEVQ